MGLFSAVGTVAGAFLGGPSGAAVGGTIGGLLDGSDEEVRSGSSEGAAAINEKFNTSKEWLTPYRDFGENQGLSGLRSLMSSPSSITETPWYQFSMSEGLRGLQNKALAGGKFFSGQTTRDVLKFSQGLASQEYGNEFTRRFSLAELGQKSGAALAGVATTSGTALGNIYQQRGQDLASIKGVGAEGLLTAATLWGRGSTNNAPVEDRGTQYIG